ncbi:MAG TPA: M23 family metallopeptidase [Flavipsychrobacter sp.]|nr:M23 family metallopeptidase [Flavipsychrobacter sp.]
MPLHGVQGKDYFVDYYVDHDSTTDIRDPFCGTKTYNGHTGTDFLIRGFKAMDSGVYVYAIADGVVFETKDSMYDRSKHWIGGSGGNHIGIIHGDTFAVYYCHLKKGSLLVTSGDTVKAGQPIAQVGSSGYSALPHLHLEIRNQKGDLIDPFSGPCQGPTHGLWRMQPAYDTALYIIDKGFVPYAPNPDTLEERYLVKDTFSVQTDSLICFWAQVHGLQSGDRIQVKWYSPLGKLWYKYKETWKSNWWNSYFWTNILMPHIRNSPIVGKWTASYYVNKKLIISQPFYITK